MSVSLGWCGYARGLRLTEDWWYCFDSETGDQGLNLQASRGEHLAEYAEALQALQAFSPKFLVIKCSTTHLTKKVFSREYWPMPGSEAALQWRPSLQWWIQTQGYPGKVQIKEINPNWQIYDFYKRSNLNMNKDF